jgi:RNA polymerase sigma-70 factor (ECF subfamily)
LDKQTASFDQVIWPHARAAYNFARWLVHNDHDAEDVAQESLLKALQSFHTLRGADVRPWLLAIVRNTAMNFITRKRPAMETEWNESAGQQPDTAPDPERSLIARSRRDRVRAAISRLQPEFREAIVLREIEGLAYKEIGFLLKIPIGTVMSRLSRARQFLAEDLLTQGVEP